MNHVPINFALPEPGDRPPPARRMPAGRPPSGRAGRAATGPSLGKPEPNGEPFGELGVVTPEDADWRDQTGAPADKQPGNSKGKKDTRRC